MKAKTSFSLLILTLVLFSFSGISQTNEILSDTDEFDYLIGTEYSDVSELSELDFKTRTARIKDKVETSSTKFTKGPLQIVTSESVELDPVSNRKVYKIRDVIVLNGYYASCGGCLVADNKDITIRSFHTIGEKMSESILLAFEQNNSTGKFKQVDPAAYTWSRKADLFRRQ